MQLKIEVYILLVLNKLSAFLINLAKHLQDIYFFPFRVDRG